MTINSNTEWGKLKEIIVGSVINAQGGDIDLSFKLFYHKNLIDQSIESELLKKSYRLKQQLIDERAIDLDNFANLLSKNGIKVHRPDKITEIKKFKTPYFDSYTRPMDNPRDLALIIGNEII